MNRLFAEISEARFVLGPCTKTDVIILVDAAKEDCTIVLPPIGKMKDSLVTIAKRDDSPNHVIIKVACNERVRGFSEWRLWQPGQSICLCPNNKNWRHPEEASADSQ